MNELLQKLSQTVSWAEHAQFYKEKLESKEIIISSLDDFYNLPPMTADDLRKYSKTISSVPREKLYALYASGGTTGKPKLMYYDEDSLEKVANVTAQALSRLFDLKSKLAILLCPADNLAAVGEYTKRALRNLGCFSGSMGLTYTDEQIKELIDVMQEEEPYLLIGNPARLTRLIRDFERYHIDPKKIGVQYVLSTSEVLTKRTREFIETSFGAVVYQGGGMTEVGWDSMECHERNGQHLLENVFAEVRDMQTGELVKEGFGELYLTTLINPAYPLVRYKTEDIIEITHKACSCGLDTPRIWYRCRRSEVVKLAANDLYAYQIDMALEKMSNVTQNYLLEVISHEDKDKVTLNIEVENEFQNDSMKEKIYTTIISSIPKLNESIHSGKLFFEVVFSNIEELPRTSRGKVANRIADKRT